jgi:hypothetical protein
MTEDDKFLGIKKETLWKVTGYSLIAVAGLGLLALL